MQYDVFISYSRKDYVDETGNVISGSIISKIKDVLKSNGISYWFDEDGINSGDEFAQLITNSIKSSKILVFVSSANSNRSEWTRKEIATAISYKKKIIPFKYDETPFDDSIYLYLADLDFISYSNNEEKSMKRLVSSINQYLKTIEAKEAMSANKKKIEEFEKEKKDLDDSRKLMLLEIEKSSVLLKSLKEKYNDTVEKMNRIERDICKLDKDRTERLVDKLVDEAAQQKKEVVEKQPKKKNGLLIGVLAAVLVYALVISVLNFGGDKKVVQNTDNVKVTETTPVVDENKSEVKTEQKTEQKTEPKPEQQQVQQPPKKEVKDATITVKGVVFDMVAVKGGTFDMGATAEQSEYASNNEKPVHKVTVSDFCIGKHEVTQGLWRAVMGVTVKQQRDLLDSSFKLRGEGDDMPIYYVSWEDCQTFIKKLNSLTGRKFRLPTEAEWEYAARGGAKSKGMMFGDGNDALVYGWIEENSNGSTHVVGQKKPNALGLYDMIGNVSEWCQDKYAKYSGSAVTNPKGPSSGYDNVVRGGCWANTFDNCRVSSRSGVDSQIRTDATGLRLVME